jgi:hypothetical protein
MDFWKVIYVVAAALARAELKDFPGQGPYWSTMPGLQKIFCLARPSLATLLARGFVGRLQGKSLPDGSDSSGFIKVGRIRPEVPQPTCKLH